MSLESDNSLYCGTHDCAVTTPWPFSLRQLLVPIAVGDWGHHYLRDGCYPVVIWRNGYLHNIIA